MGTSSSSKGPGAGVPLVPDWVPDAPSPLPDPDGDGDQPPEPAPKLLTLAPASRFGSARRSLGDFASGGGAARMQRGVGQYVRSGYGGAPSMGARMAGGSVAAGTLWSALGGASDGDASDIIPDPNVLRGGTARETLARIVNAVWPTVDTLDADAGREATHHALADVLDRYPDADLLELDDEQRLFAAERFLGLDVFHRLMLDIGKTIQDRAPSFTAGLDRIGELRDYVTSTIQSAFRALAKTSDAVTASDIRQISQTAIERSLRVFESYAE